jgi:hypothetical protein
MKVTLSGLTSAQPEHLPAMLRYRLKRRPPPWWCERAIKALQDREDESGALSQTMGQLADGCPRKRLCSVIQALSPLTTAE